MKHTRTRQQQQIRSATQLGLSSCVARIALALSVAMLVAACSGASRDSRVPEAGGGSGISRQFDEYPATLSIEGASIIESGASVTLQARADNNEYRGPAYLSSTEAQSLLVRSAPVGLMLPATVFLSEDRADANKNFLSGPIEVTAPTVATPTKFSLSLENPRASTERELTVVPSGTLYIRRLLLSQPIVEAGQVVTIEIELSQPAPAATQVQLEATFFRLDLPGSVTVPANERSVTLQVRALELPGQDSPRQEYVTVTAALNNLQQQAALWVRSNEAFVVAIELQRHYHAPSPASRGERGRVRLSKPAGPAGLTITMSNNNSLVTVPASLQVPAGVSNAEFPIEVASFVGLSAVRITATGGGTTRIGDALLGRDEGTPVIQSLTLHRLLGDGRGGFFEGGPCFDSNNRSHGIRIFGRANIVLDRPAPAGGFRVNLFARSSVLLLQQEFSIPAGTLTMGFDFDIPTGTAGEQLRFVKVIARSVDTLQERSDTLLVGEGGGSDLAELTSGSGSLGRARDFIPYFDFDPQPAAGGVLRGRVTLGEVDDGNGNFVEAHTHGSDDVPVYLSLAEADAPVTPIRTSTATLTVPALLGYADFELPLPAGAARQVVLRADTYSLDRSRMAIGPPSLCDLSYTRPIDVSAGGTLAFADVTPRYVFGGESGTVNVALSQPAPAGGAIVELTPNAPPSFIDMPSQVVVPAGSTTASVPFSTNSVAGFVTVDILARYGNSTSARVELMPEPTPLVMRFVPSTLNHGIAASLRIDLPHRYPVPLVASLADITVGLPRMLTVPNTAVMPTGQLSAFVPIPVANYWGGQRPVTVRGIVRTTTADANGEIASAFNWSDIGAPISVAGVAQMPSLISSFSLSSSLYPLALASIDTAPGAQGRLFVRRFDPAAGAWSIVGPGALNPTSITSVTQSSLLHYGIDRTPLLAFSQGNGVQQNIFAVRFDSTAGEWRNMSALQPRLNTVSGPSRAVQPVLIELPWSQRYGATVGLAFIEDGAVQFAWFDGAAWQYASPPTEMAGNARNVQFLHKGGTQNGGRIVRLVWVDDADTANPIKSAELNLEFGGWTALPALAVPPAQPGLTRLEYFAASTEVGTVVWSQSTVPAQVMSARFDGSARAWIIRPVDTIADPAARLTALSIRPQFGHVAYATDAGVGRRSVWIRRLDTFDNWVNAIPPDAVAERVVALSLGSDSQQCAVAAVRQSESGTQYTLQVRGIYAP